VNLLCGKPPKSTEDPVRTRLVTAYGAFAKAPPWEHR